MPSPASIDPARAAALAEALETLKAAHTDLGEVVEALPGADASKLAIQSRILSRLSEELFEVGQVLRDASGVTPI